MPCDVYERVPMNSDFKLNFVQCASCGGVVGVTDYFNIGGLIHTLAGKMNIRL
jgi:hypothetical protein